MNQKKATTRPPERRGISKSQIRAERRQRAEKKEEGKAIYNCFRYFCFCYISYC